jgi:hypothetical protein
MDIPVNPNSSNFNANGVWCSLVQDLDFLRTTFLGL